MEIEYKFKEIFNPKSNRLENYNYSENGGYFITICTKNRENYFGEIINGKMILNSYGKIVFDEIENVKSYNDFSYIDEFVIMPNHLHLIVMIQNNEEQIKNDFLKNKQKNVETSIYGVLKNEKYNNEDAINVCSVNKDAINKDAINGHLYSGFVKGKGGFTKENNIMLNKDKIGFIIRKLKGKITFLINKSCRDTDLSCLLYFAWQSNYYDRIIRNEDELNRIRKYIIENPLKWETDKENTENLYM